MNLIQLNVYGSEIVFNNLYDTLSEDWLDEDLVFIRLLDGTKLKAGWYADAEGGGHFKVVHFKTSWDDQLDVVTTESLNEVVRCLEGVAERALQPTIRPFSAQSEYHSIK